MSNITPEQRAELRRLHEEATPGEWIAGLDIPACANNDPDPRIVWIGSQYIGNFKSQWSASAAQRSLAVLAVAARNALPLLLDALDAAEKELADEVHDIQMIAREVEKVYCHITRDRISKPHTKAECVIDEFEERIKEAVADATEVLQQELAAATASSEHWRAKYGEAEQRVRELEATLSSASAFLRDLGRQQNPSLLAIRDMAFKLRVY